MNIFTFATNWRLPQRSAIDSYVSLTWPVLRRHSVTFLALDGQLRVLFDSLNSHNVGLQFGRHSHCPVQGLSDLNLI